LDKILSMRKSLAANGVKISVNDCVLRAVALALEQVPSANAFWSEEHGKPVQAEAVDVAVAVATKDGLFTPIVKNANKKSLTEISTDVKTLAAKARENKLKPEEFQGGSFSVSNLGMFGVDSFSAIINPPQGGIMAVGGGRKVAKMGTAGKPIVLTEMTVTLSADGRVFDGQTASDFLGAFKANMEDPFRLSIV
jgi:pyruvate dehydrogenase E2 component (dihydrolipoamide acetyltransferase)